MDLVVDRGNTRVKYATFKGGQIKQSGECEASAMERLLSDFSGEAQRLIISSVAPLEIKLLDKMQDSFATYLVLSSELSLPFTNNYQSPETLGPDRLALVAGAQGKHPNTNALVIDFGTCITFDFIDASATYHGGAISPGLEMRLKSLKEYTARLPKIQADHPEDFVGVNTKASILSGVVHGIINEVNGAIDAYKQRYPDIKIILTGGDLTFFDKKLKSGIFADENILLAGMYFILEHHANKND